MVPRRSLLVMLSLAVLSGLVFPQFALAQQPLHKLGLGGGQAMDGALPFEQVDPLSGNLVVTATDLVLPGNAGFDPLSLPRPRP